MRPARRHLAVLHQMINALDVDPGSCTIWYMNLQTIRDAPAALVNKFLDG